MPNTEIPKKMHFVWLGARRMPDANLENVAKWIRQNPAHEVSLIIHNFTIQHPKLIADYKKALKKMLVDNEKDLPKHERLKKSEIDDIIEQQIKFHDAVRLFRSKRFRKSRKLFLRELESMVPNYGSASDLARFVALLKWGGAYADSDLSPGTLSLSDFISAQGKLNEPFLAIHADAEIRNLKGPDDLANFAIGNDFFVTTVNNPIIGALLENIVASYYLDQTTSALKSASPEEIDEKLKAVKLPRVFSVLRTYYSSDLNKFIKQQRSPLLPAYLSRTQEYLVSSTIFRTGPGILRLTILDELTKEGRGQLARIPGACRTVDIDLANSWISLNPRDVGDYEQGLKKIEEMILFDYQSQAILRLDDHIDDLFKLYHQTKSKSEILKDIFSLAKRLVAENQMEFRAVQAISRRVTRFCERNNLLQNNFFHPTMKSLIENPEEHQLTVDILFEFLAGHRYENGLRGEKSEETMKNILQRLSKGFKLMNKVLAGIVEILSDPGISSSDLQILQAYFIKMESLVTEALQRTIDKIEHYSASAQLNKYQKKVEKVREKYISLDQLFERIKNANPKLVHSNIDESSRVTPARCKTFTENLRSFFCLGRSVRRDDEPDPDNDNDNDDVPRDCIK